MQSTSSTFTRTLSLLAAENGVDGSKNLKMAQACFASLFDQNSVDNLGKTNKKGEFTRLPNDVMAKQGDIYIWRVNNSQLKDWWTRNGKDSHGIDNYEKQEIESTEFLPTASTCRCASRHA